MITLKSVTFGSGQDQWRHIVPFGDGLAVKASQSVEKEVYKTALFFSLLNLIHTLFLFYFFVPNSISFQFQSFGIFGIDGISLWLIW
jgi:hypothetical protein